MRSFFTALWCSGAAVFLVFAFPSPAQVDETPLDLLRQDPSDAAVVRYVVIGREVAIWPQDVAALEFSESGGITDIFVRLTPNARRVLADMTELAIGTPMQVKACGTVLLEVVVQAPITSGTIYIADTTMVRAEAMRALWHGRDRCDTLAPEVFDHGQ